ncbi:MAG: hypothetical protein JWR69_2143 [Pedosphaera sp.]|nr:hypothetical protein [Pedosphaera sp.]
MTRSTLSQPSVREPAHTLVDTHPQCPGVSRVREQTLKPHERTGLRTWVIGIWKFFGAWDLVIGHLGSVQPLQALQRWPTTTSPYSKRYIAVTCRYTNPPIRYKRLTGPRGDSANVAAASRRFPPVARAEAPALSFPVRANGPFHTSLRATPQENTDAPSPSANGATQPSKSADVVTASRRFPSLPRGSLLPTPTWVAEQSPGLPDAKRATQGRTRPSLITLAPCAASPSEHLHVLRSVSPNHRPPFTRENNPTHRSKRLDLWRKGGMLGGESSQKPLQFRCTQQMKWKSFNVVAILPDPGAKTGRGGERKRLPPSRFQKSAQPLDGNPSDILIYDCRSYIDC